LGHGAQKSFVSAESSIEFNARRMVSYLHTASSIDSSLRKSARAFILSESFQTLCGKGTHDPESALLEHWQAANAENVTFKEHMSEGDSGSPSAIGIIFSNLKAPESSAKPEQCVLQVLMPVNFPILRR
jgi:hypothetical protein